MMILWDEKLAFLAVPKTGSTAIEGALAPNSAILFRNPPHLKHMTLVRFVRFFDSYLQNTGINALETMAIIREPVDWLGSWYRYRYREDLRGKRNSTYGISFDSFVQQCCRGDERPAFAKIGAQANFLSGGDTGLTITHLFRYDQFSTAIDFLEDRVGKALKLSRKNVSLKMELELSAETRSLYQTAFSDDFEIYESLKS